MSQFIIFILFSILNLMFPFQCPEFSTFLIFSHFANFHANSWKIFFQQLIVNFPWSSFRPKTAKERRLQIINKSRWTIEAQFWPCASFILSWMYPHHFFFVVVSLSADKQVFTPIIPMILSTTHLFNCSLSSIIFPLFFASTVV